MVIIRINLILTSRGLLFCQLGVATGEVVGNINARFYSNDHAGCQHSISVDSECVVSVHTEIVTNVMGVKPVHGLVVGGGGGGGG